MTDAATDTSRHENLEAEVALLGGLMLDNTFIDTVSEILKQDDFAAPVHGRIYRALLRLRAHGELATPITLKPIFDDDEDLEAVGGAKYLASITAQAAVVVGVMDFARQIAALSNVRRARAALTEAVEKIDKQGEMPDIGIIQGDLDVKLWAARDRSEPLAFNSSHDLIGEAIERARTVSENDTVLGASNKFVSDLNKGLGPLEPGTYNLFAGRPSMGKTVLAVSAALGYAANGHPTDYLFAEGTQAHMALRVAANLCHATHADITHDDIKYGRMSEQKFDHLRRVQEMARSLPVNFVGIGRADVALVDSLIARSCAKWDALGRKLEVVVIDYLQLLGAGALIGRSGFGNDRAEVNAISGALLKAAQRHNVALIVLSQLSRKVEDRPGAVPQMSDLRESGRLEEDADSVTLIYRPEYYLERSKPPAGAKEVEITQWETDFAKARGRVDLIVAKNRHGKVGTKPAQFFGKNYSIRGSDFGAHDSLFDGDTAPIMF